MRVVEVELFRSVDDSDPDDLYVSWGAEWGVRESGEGAEDDDKDLAVLVHNLLDELRPVTAHCAVQLEWTFGGLPPEGMTIADAVAETSVTLPTAVF